jgi:hypothetical protein
MHSRLKAGQVLVDAIVNTGPREDSTRIGSQGTVRRQAVDVSPLRRVNQAVSLITIGVRDSHDDVYSIFSLTFHLHTYRPVSRRSGTSSPSRSAWPMSSSTPPRARPTRTPSRYVAVPLPMLS